MLPNFIPSEAQHKFRADQSLEHIDPEIHRHAERLDYLYFAAHSLTGPKEPPYNGQFLAVSHHRKWNEQVKAEPRICNLAHRDSGKSFFFSKGYPIWRAYNEPNKQGMVFSATDAQAKEKLGQIIFELEENPKLQFLLPTGARKKFNKREIRLTNGHEIIARGWGTKVRGYHPHYILCDDVLNDEDIYSELVRRKNIDYFYSAIPLLFIK